MESSLGRFFEDWPLETKMLLKTLYDVGTGAGRDVQVWIDGRELVFTRRGPRADRGFLRLIPTQASVIVAFPLGDRLLDPRKRLKGVAGSQRTMVLGYSAEVDLDVRRFVLASYAEAE